jgi:5-methyltetrahydropteroyltriglutamate--homocysteine methyltransferase
MIQFDEPALMQLAGPCDMKPAFMMAALPARNAAAAELELAVQLINELVAGIDGVKFGVHVCRGNWTRNEEALLRGDYAPLLPSLMAMNVHQLILEMATSRAGGMAVFRDYAGQKEIGLGVVNPRSDEVETPDSIIERVREALEYFDPEEIWLNPDCGFASFAERNLNTPETAQAKLASIVEAARRLRHELGPA